MSDTVSKKKRRKIEMIDTTSKEEEKEEAKEEDEEEKFPKDEPRRKRKTKVSLTEAHQQMDITNEMLGIRDIVQQEEQSKFIQKYSNVIPDWKAVYDIRNNHEDIVDYLSQPYLAALQTYDPKTNFDDPQAFDLLHQISIDFRQKLDRMKAKDYMKPYNLLEYDHKIMKSLVESQNDTMIRMVNNKEKFDENTINQLKMSEYLASSLEQLYQTQERPVPSSIYKYEVAMQNITNAVERPAQKVQNEDDEQQHEMLKFFDKEAKKDTFEAVIAQDYVDLLKDQKFRQLRKLDLHSWKLIRTNYKKESRSLTRPLTSNFKENKTDFNENDPNTMSFVSDLAKIIHSTEQGFGNDSQRDLSMAHIITHFKFNEKYDDSFNTLSKGLVYGAFDTLMRKRMNIVQEYTDNQRNLFSPDNEIALKAFNNLQKNFKNWNIEFLRNSFILNNEFFNNTIMNIGTQNNPKYLNVSNLLSSLTQLNNGIQSPTKNSYNFDPAANLYQAKILQMYQLFQPDVPLQQRINQNLYNSKLGQAALKHIPKGIVTQNWRDDETYFKSAYKIDQNFHEDKVSFLRQMMQEDRSNLEPLNILDKDASTNVNYGYHKDSFENLKNQQTDNLTLIYFNKEGKLVKSKMTSNDLNQQETARLLRYSYGFTDQKWNEALNQYKNQLQDAQQLKLRKGITSQQLNQPVEEEKQQFIQQEEQFANQMGRTLIVDQNMKDIEIAKLRIQQLINSAGLNVEDAKDEDYLNFYKTITGDFQIKKVQENIVTDLRDDQINKSVARMNKDSVLQAINLMKSNKSLDYRWDYLNRFSALEYGNSIDPTLYYLYDKDFQQRQVKQIFKNPLSKDSEYLLAQQSNLVALSSINEHFISQLLQANSTKETNEYFRKFTNIIDTAYKQDSLLKTNNEGLGRSAGVTFGLTQDIDKLQKFIRKFQIDNFIDETGETYAKNFKEGANQILQLRERFEVENELSSFDRIEALDQVAQIQKQMREESADLVKTINLPNSQQKFELHNTFLPLSVIGNPSLLRLNSQTYTKIMQDRQEWDIQDRKEVEQRINEQYEKTPEQIRTELLQSASKLNDEYNQNLTQFVQTKEIKSQALTDIKSKLNDAKNLADTASKQAQRIEDPQKLIQLFSNITKGYDLMNQAKNAYTQQIRSYYEEEVKQQNSEKAITQRAESKQMTALLNKFMEITDINDTQTAFNLMSKNISNLAQAQFLKDGKMRRLSNENQLLKTQKTDLENKLADYKKQQETLTKSQAELQKQLDNVEKSMHEVSELDFEIKNKDQYLKNLQVLHDARISQKDQELQQLRQKIKEQKVDEMQGIELENYAQKSRDLEQSIREQKINFQTQLGNIRAQLDAKEGQLQKQDFQMSQLKAENTELQRSNQLMKDINISEASIEKLKAEREQLEVELARKRTDIANQYALNEATTKDAQSNQKKAEADLRQLKVDIAVFVRELDLQELKIDDTTDIDDIQKKIVKAVTQHEKSTKKYQDMKQDLDKLKDDYEDYKKKIQKYPAVKLYNLTDQIEKQDKDYVQYLSDNFLQNQYQYLQPDTFKRLNDEIVEDFKTVEKLLSKISKKYSPSHNLNNYNREQVQQEETEKASVINFMIIVAQQRVAKQLALLDINQTLESMDKINVESVGDPNSESAHLYEAQYAAEKDNLEKSLRNLAYIQTQMDAYKNNLSTLLYRGEEQNSITQKLNNLNVFARNTIKVVLTEGDNQSILRLSLNPHYQQVRRQLTELVANNQDLRTKKYQLQGNVAQLENAIILQNHKLSMPNFRDVSGTSIEYMTTKLREIVGQMKQIDILEDSMHEKSQNILLNRSDDQVDRYKLLVNEFNIHKNQINASRDKLYNSTLKMIENNFEVRGNVLYKGIIDEVSQQQLTLTRNMLDEQIKQGTLTIQVLGSPFKAMFENILKSRSLILTDNILKYSKQTPETKQRIIQYADGSLARQHTPSDYLTKVNQLAREIQQHNHLQPEDLPSIQQELDKLKVIHSENIKPLYPLIENEVEKINPEHQAQILGELKKFLDIFNADGTRLPYNIQSAQAIKQLKLDLKPGNLFNYTHQILSEQQQRTGGVQIEKSTLQKISKDAESLYQMFDQRNEYAQKQLIYSYQANVANKDEFKTFYMRQTGINSAQFEDEYQRLQMTHAQEDRLKMYNQVQAQFEKLNDSNLQQSLLVSYQNLQTAYQKRAYLHSQYMEVPSKMRAILNDDNYNEYFAQYTELEHNKKKINEEVYNLEQEVSKSFYRIHYQKNISSINYQEYIDQVKKEIQGYSQLDTEQERKLRNYLTTAPMSENQRNFVRVEKDLRIDQIATQMANIAFINKYIFEYDKLGNMFIQNADKENKNVRQEVLSFYPLMLQITDWGISQSQLLIENMPPDHPLLLPLLASKNQLRMTTDEVLNNYSKIASEVFQRESEQIQKDSNFDKIFQDFMSEVQPIIETQQKKILKTDTSNAPEKLGFDALNQVLQTMQTEVIDGRRIFSSEGMVKFQRAFKDKSEKFSLLSKQLQSDSKSNQQMKQQLRESLAKQKLYSSAEINQRVERVGIVEQFYRNQSFNLLTEFQRRFESQLDNNLKRNKKVLDTIVDNYNSLDRPTKLTFEGQQYRKLLEKRKQTKQNQLYKIRLIRNQIRNLKERQKDNSGKYGFYLGSMLKFNY